MKTLKEKYAKEKPVGSYCLCNTAAVVFYEPLEEDRCDCDFVLADVFMESYSNFRRHKAYYAKSGRPYVNWGRNRIYMDEVMRI